MYVIEKVIDLLTGQGYPLVWGVLLTLIGYLIYLQYNSSQDMEKRLSDLLGQLQANHRSHLETQELMRALRGLIKEDLLPILRNVEKSSQEVNNIMRNIDDLKDDSRGWHSSLREDLNQFRSEFRDILKLTMNGRKNNCE